MLLIPIFIISLYHEKIIRQKEELKSCNNELSNVQGNIEILSISTNKTITGLYYPETKYMVVSLENRSWSSVMETCNHEFLHHKYKNHFIE